MTRDLATPGSEGSSAEDSPNRITRRSFLKTISAMSLVGMTCSFRYNAHQNITGIPTGFTCLDKMTGGLQTSDLVILAGRPHMGKTSFALNVARYASLAGNIGVGIFSLELSRRNLLQRLSSSFGHLNYQRIHADKQFFKDWPRGTGAVGLPSKASIFIDDTPAITVSELRLKARRITARYSHSLIIVDYLQLMRGVGTFGSRSQEIGQVLRGLKAMAEEMNSAVLVLSQLHRSLESRADKRPVISDFRELEYAIRQNADTICFIYRDEYYARRESNPNRGIAEIIIRRQRNGPAGTVKLPYMKAPLQATDIKVVSAIKNPFKSAANRVTRSPRRTPMCQSSFRL